MADKARERSFGRAYNQMRPVTLMPGVMKNATGSCLAGRKAFCEDRGLDYEHGHYTVNEFIRLTRNAYGGEAIEELEKTLP